MPVEIDAIASRRLCTKDIADGPVGVEQIGTNPGAGDAALLVRRTLGTPGATVLARAVGDGAGGQVKGCECSHFVIGITQQHLRHQDCLVGAVRESARKAFLFGERTAMHRFRVPAGAPLGLTARIAHERRAAARADVRSDIYGLRDFRAAAVLSHSGARDSRAPVALRGRIG
ncbi:MAG TPA: hypothetical protein H9837_14425 [Candidatus Brachybacterium merdigallinarum]|nr:hypothetical protein [Candidatus Brachybacterium merdigallinarum]